jgi:prepilin-type processing-associated H-X9-DG protein
MPRICLKRHAGRFVNVAFVDGHAESVLLPDLWQLKWSNGFVPTARRIPGF